MAKGSKHPRLQFNPYFTGGDPLADEIYGHHRQLALRESPKLSSFSWLFSGTAPGAAMASDLQAMLKTHLSGLKIDLKIERTYQGIRSPW